MLHKERGKGGQGMKSMTDAIVFGRFMISGLWFCILLLAHLCGTVQAAASSMDM
jgi:hypothetical protein